MITIYCNTRSGSTAQIEKWMKKNYLSYQVIFPSDLNHEFLFKILQLSENGFDSLLVSKKRGIKTWRALNLTSKKLENYRVSQLMHLLLEYPKLLKVPITFDDKHLLVGYNSEEIRVFLSSDYRSLKRGKLFL